MDNRLANGLLRLSGRITGIEPHAWLEKLEPMQWWGQEQMHQWQCEELERTLAHARATVPYYQRTLPRNGGQWTPERLSELPVLTKDQVQKNLEELHSTAPGPGKPLEVSTSGSTGRPLKVRVDRDAFARYFAAKLRALAWYGVRFADRQVRVWGFPFHPLQRANWAARDLLQNRIRLVSFDLSEETLEAFYEKCLRFRPTYINGYTSAIHRFASFIEGSGKDGAALGLKVTIPTSEVLYDWQREEMERAFGCPVMNEYGCGELQAIAYQCSHGWMHITHENLILEVLDEGGNPVPDGQPGLLTVTSLCNRAMPMIRYQNGDIVVGNREVSCKCGRYPGLPALSRVIGRSADVLYRTDGEPAHWTVLYYAIKETFTPGMVTEHQAVQEANDRMELRIVKGPDYKEQAMEQFLVKLKSLLGQDLDIEVVFVDEIQREGSGKLRYFVSEIPKAQQRALPGNGHGPEPG
jgi:phenylacetate-CoA ligase